MPVRGRCEPEEPGGRSIRFSIASHRPRWRGRSSYGACCRVPHQERRWCTALGPWGRRPLSLLPVLHIHKFLGNFADLAGELIHLHDLSDLDGLVRPAQENTSIAMIFRLSRVSFGPPGHFLAHAIASSREATSMIQKPPTTSLTSANGPSVTTGSPEAKETRAPMEGGCRPSAATSTPAFCRASLYFIMAETASISSGMVPGGAFS